MLIHNLYIFQPCGTFSAMVVRMRHTRSHTRNRRSHHALVAPAVTMSSVDGVSRRHRVSPVTGKYRGRQVVNVEKKLDKKIAKKGGKGSK